MCLDENKETNRAPDGHIAVGIVPDTATGIFNLALRENAIRGPIGA